MQRVNLNGVDLEYDVQGSGEPLLLIHGSIVADAFFPLLLVVPQATHALQLMNPSAVADGLARFFARHKL